MDERVREEVKVCITGWTNEQIDGWAKGKRESGREGERERGRYETMKEQSGKKNDGMNEKERS